MTLQRIQENLEHARDRGLSYKLSEPPSRDIIVGTPTNGTVGLDGYTKLYPGLHEAKLYSICEGLIAEIERLQKRVDTLEAQLSQVDRRTVGMTLLGGLQQFRMSEPSHSAFEAGLEGRPE